MAQAWSMPQTSSALAACTIKWLKLNTTTVHIVRDAYLCNHLAQHLNCACIVDDATSTKGKQEQSSIGVRRCLSYGEKPEKSMRNFFQGRFRVKLVSEYYAKNSAFRTGMGGSSCCLLYYFVHIGEPYKCVEQSPGFRKSPVFLVRSLYCSKLLVGW